MNVYSTVGCPPSNIPQNIPSLYEPEGTPLASYLPSRVWPSHIIEAI